MSISKKNPSPKSSRAMEVARKPSRRDPKKVFFRKPFYYTTATWFDFIDDMRPGEWNMFYLYEIRPDIVERRKLERCLQSHARRRGYRIHTKLKFPWWTIRKEQ